MSALLCDSGPLIATFNPGDPRHARCTVLLANWSGRLLIPEPVLGETCNFLRNHARNGPRLEARLLAAVTRADGDFEIVDPTPADRSRAAELVDKLVSAPLGYVDATVLAAAERLTVPDIATVDFKFLGMANPVSKLRPLNWVLQEE